MDFTPILPTNMRGDVFPELLEMAGEIRSRSAALAGTHTPELLTAVTEMLRIVNSYYSNKIESDGTHPVKIEKAMRREYSTDSRERALQTLSVAHIQTQQEIDRIYADPDAPAPYRREFIRWVHGALYEKEGMEPFLNIEHEGKRCEMVPGAFRKHDVAVGGHDAPGWQDVDGLMGRFEDLYLRTQRNSTDIRVVAAFASHHRLAWIHPFLDGNGRTSRLLLDAALRHTGLEGYGLWNFSRGLARNQKAYGAALARADMPRQGATDGRGALSAGSLGDFVRFMGETALDQITYMGRYLRMNELAERIERYVVRSQHKELTIEPLPKHTERIFKELLLRGSMGRGEETMQLLGLKRTAASAIVNELVARGYLTSETPKGNVRLKFESHFAHHLFPELTSENVSAPAPWNSRR